MIMKLVSDKRFEIAGTVFGLLASASISTQVYAEMATDRPSTVSVVYAAGFLIIFAFWTLYGIRFNRVAMWLTNGIATLVQAILVIVIVLKQFH
jgi:uncharacterized protein with PQ loop repeat